MQKREINQVNLKAYGKINLCLDVLGRREDGYHEVQMIMQTVGIFDRISMEKQPAGCDKITIETNVSYLPTGESNLVYRAIDLLRKEFSITQGVSVKLRKVIPVAAGMAGGSADAAAALVGMNRLFRLGLSGEQLMERGLLLGADVPFCVMRGTALSEGIGEKLTRLPAPPACTILIAKPKVSASTKLVYERYDSCTDVQHPDTERVIEGLKTGDLDLLCDSMGNVLEQVTAEEYPIIRDISKQMTEGGARGAMMTGSGPTVFGLFKEAAQAEQVKKLLLSDDRMRQVYVTEWFIPQAKSAADMK